MIVTTLLITTIIISIPVIITRNPINSVIGLILIFILSSLYLITLGINFIAFLYLIIYVGAIAILFLFVIMMMNIKYTLVL
jgi:NADH-ubiquinone oxidoreductase chain 6